MSKQPLPDSYANTYKQVDVGQAVILDDSFLKENNHLRKIEAQAEEFLSEARLTAQETVANAQERARKIIDDAKIKGIEDGNAQREAILQEGYDAGYQAGYQQAAQEVCDNLQAASAIVEKAYEVKSTLIEKHQDMLCEMMQVVLHRILKDSLNTQPQMIMTVLKQALNQLQLTGKIRVVLNSQTYSQLKNFSPETFNQFEKLEHIVFEPDHNCGAFNMYLLGLDVTYDLSPQTQVEQLVSAVAPQIASLAPEAASET